MLQKSTSAKPSIFDCFQPTHMEPPMAPSLFPDPSRRLCFYYKVSKKYQREKPLSASLADEVSLQRREGTKLKKKVRWLSELSSGLHDLRDRNIW
ncbi:hypothetical protein MKW98_002566 [Papaver atlanticum]|uniref:Uncharacterized protein n=1 Tax=Papaver atlanticum TaxID=357466 RepID=A0AAD4SAD1_9MAGN|nr:hypothetical protein MKW98_002566 [Papaver atlanticum]